MTDDVHVVTMPKLGETVTEGAVSRWLKSVGDMVAFDDPLLEVSTDKVDSEIPSPYDGVVLELLVPEGETVPVGTELARIGPPADGGTQAKTPVAGGTSAKLGDTGDEPEPVTAVGSQRQASAPVALAPTGNGSRPVLSPVVRRLAAENDLDLATVSGSGAGGRIRREDVLSAIADRASSTSVREAPDAEDTPVTEPVAPLMPGHREEQVPLSRIRLVTAERMVESRRISPHVWTSVEVDLERVEQARLRHKEEFKKHEGASLTYLPFIARATIDALRAFPAVNSSLDVAHKTMTLHRYVNLGIAVDLDEQGLMAPVIKDADTLNLRGLARGIKTVANAAAERTLKADDLTGSTFTITNPGPLGSYASAAIINQPNVAILATDGVARRPTVVGDAIAIHHMGILGLSYDHRAFDGVTAAKFLKYIREALQQRDWEAELA